MIYFILGILLMSLFATIGVYLIDDGYTFAPLLMGPIAWTVCIFILLYDKITHYLKYRNVRSLLICPDGKIRYIKDQLADTMRECEDRKYDFPTFVEYPEWNVNDWNKDFVFLDIGNVRYAPKKVWKQYEPISKEEITYAKDNPYKIEDEE